MKILKVIHGYPMRYNAGSEVYTQTLCQALADRHDVAVFTREEDPFSPDGRLRLDRDSDDPRVRLHVVNNPRNKDRYRVAAIDARFGEVLDSVNPDVVHVGHLNHLSSSLLREAASRSVPIVYTLHDYWLMCPRGQFMQMFSESGGELWSACDGQEDRKCAERCYARYFSGAPGEWNQDVAHWTTWVARRMRHMREMTDLVDVFIAPARYLLERYQRDFAIPPRNLVYLDYGFNHGRLAGRLRESGEPFTFGYIGTHIPAKGIHLLIEAFGRLRGETQLRMWGRDNGQNTAALRNLARALPQRARSRIEWLPEYQNQGIVPEVLNRVDAIVVPSVWVENSPLVIHEAQQARVPVIAGDVGGMAEYVHHERNGLLFHQRDVEDLATQMKRMVDDAAWAAQLGRAGYPYSATGDVPSVEEHAAEVERLYERCIREKRSVSR